MGQPGNTIQQWLPQGQPESWAPTHPQVRCLRAGGRGAGEMLPPLPYPPGGPGSSRTRPYPPSHSKVWGRGATSSASEGGSGAVTCPGM